MRTLVGIAAGSVAVIVLGAFAIAALWHPRATGDGSGDALAAAGGDAAGAVDPLAPATGDDAAPPAAGRMVHLSLRATPPAARFHIDGGPPLSNPYLAQVPADGNVHMISISARGFATWSQSVAFDDDISIQVSLARAAPRPGPTRTRR
jgi:hypothetical protein